MPEDDNWLLLSGIQHYAYCPRQWALIHVEQQWLENTLTASGRIMHERCIQIQGMSLEEMCLPCVVCELHRIALR